MGEDEDGGAFSGELDISYRIERNWKVGFSFSGMVHTIVGDDSTFAEALNISEQGKAEAYGSRILQDDGTSRSLYEEELENLSLSYHLELSRTMMGAGVTGGIKGEFFFLPRMALNGGVSFLYNYTFLNQDPYTKSDSGEAFYGYEDRSYKAYGLNPFMLPDGRILDESLFSANYVKVFLGISLYY